MLHHVRQIMRHILVAILITNTVTANAQHRNQRRQQPSAADIHSRNCKRQMSTILQVYRHELGQIPRSVHEQLRTSLLGIESTVDGRAHVNRLKETAQNDSIALRHARGSDFQQVSAEIATQAYESAAYVDREIRAQCDATPALQCSADESSINICLRPRANEPIRCLQCNWLDQPPSHSSVPITRTVFYIGTSMIRSFDDYLAVATTPDVARYRQECLGHSTQSHIIQPRHESISRSIITPPQASGAEQD